MASHGRFSTGQRAAIGIFALLLIGAAGMAGWRIVQRPAYEAREQMQCDLLAASALEALAALTAGNPQLWAQFDAETALVIDHRRMPNGWNVLLSVRVEDDRVATEVTAASGWNSRIPKEARFQAMIPLDGSAISYPDAYARRCVEAVRALDAPPGGEILSFMFRNEKEPRNPIRVRLSKVRVGEADSPFLILMPVR